MALVVPNIFSTSNTSVFTLAQLDQNFSYIFQSLTAKGSILAQGPTTGSFSVPSGVSAMRIVLNAGGGGGAGPTYVNGLGGPISSPYNVYNGGGSGGAGGNVYFVLTNLTPGQVFTYTLGAAGTAGAYVAGGIGGTGGTGGLSTLACAALGFSITCTGGNGGGVTAQNVVVGGAGGAGGSFSFTTGTATISAISGSTVNGNVQINGSSTVTNGLLVTGETTLNGNTSLNGVASFKTDTWHTDGQGNQRLHFGNNADNYYKSPNGWHSFRNAGDSSTMQIDPRGNVSIYGNLNVNGDISVPIGKTVNIGNVLINSGTYNGRNFIRFGGDGGNHQMVYYIDSTHIFD